MAAEIVYIENGDDPNDDAVIETYLAQYAEAKETKEKDSEVEHEEEVAEVLELDEDEDPDDDDIIDFYLQQSINKAKRTSPMSEAATKKNYTCNKCKFNSNTKSAVQEHEKSKHKIKCNKCNFSTETSVQLNLHKEAQHSGTTDESTNDKDQPTTTTVHRCKYCDFVAKSTEQLKKHMDVRANDFRHGRKKEETNQRAPIPCRYQEFCNRFNCPFSHNSQMRNKCRFGAFCENSACRLDHRNIFLG